MLTLDEVLAHDDPYPHVLELAASGDRSLIAPARAAAQRFADASDWHGAGLMARILVGVEGSQAVPLLLAILAPVLRDEHFEDPEMLRLSVGRALSEDPAGCRSTVLAAVASSDPDLHRAGLWALGAIAGPDDLGLIRQGMAGPDPSTRRQTLTGLSDDAALREIAVEALRDSDEWVRREAVIRLGWSGPASMLDLLIPMAADPSSAVRSIVGEAIVRLAAPRPESHDAAAEALRSLLTDTNHWARTRAAVGLSVLRGAGSGPGGPLVGEDGVEV
ncbi:HEAT repeat domain-containing protein [Paractinoplanes atraurantiacus]|uniref:HEAT repeat-containing protein n=1 Tax=Paractinoplanes atraurantiacus TaxID=1036182 RepID=A0A285J3F8_9ACTN|nr:HEAT repeat domain-containing protein [Actinoplanes atraurantiacus]SNY54397.1 HEAT repeat-containing protein [Actinoplanes atraurantiacus]